MGEERPFYAFLTQSQASLVLLLFITLISVSFFYAFSFSRTELEQASVVQGQRLFAENCIGCHRVTDDFCFDISGYRAYCRTRSLKSYDLLCGDETYYMAARNWQGTKRSSIKLPLIFGINHGHWRARSARFGGTLNNAEVDSLTNYVLNLADEDFCTNPDPPPRLWPETFAQFTSKVGFKGDAVAGYDFYKTYGCSGCHGDLNIPNSHEIGPHLGQFGSKNTFHADPMQQAEYLYESILYPNAHIVADCPTGPCAIPSAMPASFVSRFGHHPKDLVDIIAYLLYPHQTGKASQLENRLRE